VGIFRRRSQETRDFTSVPPIPPYPGAPNDYAALNSDPLRNASVWRAVNLLSTTVAMLPAFAYRQTGPVRQLLPSQPKILTDPSIDADPMEWVEMVMRCLLLRGNAVGLVASRDSMGRATQVELLPPEILSVRPHGTGWEYLIQGKPVSRDELWLQRAYRWPGMPLGMAPITYHAMTIGINLQAQKFGYGWFNEGHIPAAVLSSDQPIDPAQARIVKDQFIATNRGREPVVLGRGLSYEAIAIKPEESQFLKTQEYGVSEIARVFGVPAEMIGGSAGNSMTYANVEQRSIDFLTYSVQPWLTKLERALTRMLPQPQYVKFDTTELLRTDTETRYRSHAIGVAAKFLTPDEARVSEDLAPLTEEQKTLLALVPLTVGPTGRPSIAPQMPTTPPPSEEPK
jgi:HK97 family phage portal protein